MLNEKTYGHFFPICCSSVCSRAETRKKENDNWQQWIVSHLSNKKWQTFAGFAVWYVRVWCFSLSYVIMNRISLDFGLSVRQYKQFENATLGCKELGWALYTKTQRYAIYNDVKQKSRKSNLSWKQWIFGFLAWYMTNMINL